MKTLKWFMLFSGILIAAFGIWLLFTPTVNMVRIAFFICLSMLISGISEISAFCGEEKGKRSWWLLVGGILSTLLGIWGFIGRGFVSLSIAIPFMFAFWIISTSIMRSVNSFSLKSSGSKTWGWLFALGILGAIFGFILMLHPILSAAIVSFVLAFTFISYGVNNIVLFFSLTRLKKNIIKKLFE